MNFEDVDELSDGDVETLKRRMGKEKKSRWEKVKTALKIGGTLVAVGTVAGAGAYLYSQRGRIIAAANPANPTNPDTGGKNENTRTVDYSQDGGERPFVDDPNITGEGGFSGLIENTGRAIGAVVETIGENILTTSRTIFVELPQSAFMTVDGLGGLANSFGEMVAAGRNMVYIYIDGSGNTNFMFANADGTWPADRPPGGQSYNVSSANGGYNIQQINMG